MAAVGHVLFGNGRWIFRLKAEARGSIGHDGVRVVLDWFDRYLGPVTPAG
jgi:hypothetical protein